MSTRATIQVKGAEESISIYKHHDGYVKNGLGEYLGIFMSHAESSKNTFGSIARMQPTSFPSRFSAWGLQTFGSNAYLHELQIIALETDSNTENNTYMRHGDTEYHYTIENGKLFVQVRDWDNKEQNGDKHWTLYAPKVELLNVRKKDYSMITFQKTIEKI
jgi:hypothetical protein